MIGAQASACLSFHKPVQPGVMRPSGDTAVASAITSAAPPMARAPRCTMCHSFGTPSSAEYWHMGETAMRLRRATPLMRNSEKSCDMEEPDRDLPILTQKFQNVSSNICRMTAHE